MCLRNRSNGSDEGRYANTLCWLSMRRGRLASSTRGSSHSGSARYHQPNYQLDVAFGVLGVLCLACKSAGSGFSTQRTQSQEMSACQALQICQGLWPLRGQSLENCQVVSYADRCRLQWLQNCISRSVKGGSRKGKNSRKAICAMLAICPFSKLSTSAYKRIAVSLGVSIEAMASYSSRWKRFRDASSSEVRRALTSAKRSDIV